MGREDVGALDRSALGNYLESQNQWLGSLTSSQSEMAITVWEVDQLASYRFAAQDWVNSPLCNC